MIRGSGADACSTCTSALDGTIRAQKEGPTSQRHRETEQMGPCKSVDSTLDQDEAELGVLVLAVLVKVLSDGHGLGNKILHSRPFEPAQAGGLLDEVVEILL